ncbi:MAG: GerW family sporulation protein [Anaeroplasmataceae bacterium]
MDQKVNTLLKVSLDSIKDMIDVNTIIGDRVIIDSDTSIIPVSRVRMGFVSGGGDLSLKDNPPFTGGSGATMGITPIGFLTIYKGEIKFVNTNESSSFELICNILSNVIGKIDDYFKKKAINNIEK